MHSKWKWTTGHRQVLARHAAVNGYRICRDKLGFSREQARLFLRRSALATDLQAAERIYNQEH